MKEAQDQGSDHCDRTTKNKFRQEPNSDWTCGPYTHLKSPMAALAKALEGLEQGE